MTNVNPIPWSFVVLAGAIAGGFALYGHAYSKGYAAAENTAKVQFNEHLTRAIEQANRQNAEDALILRAASEQQSAIRTQIQTIIKKVTQYVAQNPVYQRCELDACGLCLARAAASGADSASCPCGLDAALPSAARAPESDAWGLARNLHRDGGAVPGVPGATPGAGGLGGGTE